MFSNIRGRSGNSAILLQHSTAFFDSCLFRALGIWKDPGTIDIGELIHGTLSVYGANATMATRNCNMADMLSPWPIATGLGASFFSDNPQQTVRGFGGWTSRQRALNYMGNPLVICNCLHLHLHLHLLVTLTCFGGRCRKSRHPSCCYTFECTQTQLPVVQSIEVQTHERMVPQPLSELQGRSPRMAPPLQEDDPWFVATQQVRLAPSPHYLLQRSELFPHPMWGCLAVGGVTSCMKDRLTC